MKLYQIPLGICKEEFSKAILVGLAHSDLLQGKDGAQNGFIWKVKSNVERSISDPLPDPLLSAIESGNIRCDRSWSSPPDDYLVMLATYARGEEPAEC